MVIITIAVALLLVIIAATQPVVTRLSQFELERRRKANTLPHIDSQRAEYAADITTLMRLLSALLLVVFVPCSIAAFGWIVGIIASVVLAIEYQAIARLGFFRSIANKVYSLYEKYLLLFCEKARWFFTWFRAVDDSLKTGQQVELFSKEELVETLKRSPTILSKSEARLVDGALSFSAKTVKDIMTPRSVIDSISHEELLGPVTLSELHKTGHSRFPVIDGDMDHVVGVLYVRDLLAVDGTKNSQKVSEVMDRTVCFIHEDQTLDQALAAFLKTQKLLFVVVNEFRETVGLLSLEDIIEELLGQKINDEFEKHSDLRAVAARNPRKNNTPDKAKNV